MLSRHLCRVRAWWAAGLLIGGLAGLPASAQEPVGDVPGPESATETVEILKAREAGDLDVTVRGQGADHVKFKVKNTSKRRLNVVLPPGLVAASTVAQGAGGGFQSMGLGTPTRHNGSFGQFQGGGNDAEGGFRSVSPKPSTPEGIAVSAGQTVEFSLPSVCLNFGIPTPTPKNEFRLMDVNDYTPDARVRKALRSLATLGTSQGVAQAAMWHVANGMSFEQMAQQAAKYVNLHELAVAERFVEALDGTGSSDLVEPSHFNQARILLRVSGEGALAKTAHRLRSELDGRRLMGLPVQLADDDSSAPHPSTLALNVVLQGGKNGQRFKVAVRHAPITGGWALLGVVDGKAEAVSSSMEADALLRGIEKAVASEFISTRIVRRNPGTTTFEIKNRLPLTLADVTLRAGRADDAPTVPYRGIGVGPARTGQATISAPAGVVDRIVLNGL